MARNDDVFFRPVEVDWVEFIAGFGLPVTFFLGVMIACGISCLLFKWLIHRQKGSGVAFFAASSFVLHGALAGHALASPMPSTAIALVLAWSATLLIQSKKTTTKQV
jgi:hypothetical protein